MTMGRTLAKICGLKTPQDITAAIEGGADFIGFVFHPTSPRFVEVEVAAYLASYIPARTKICALFADPDDETLSACLSAVRVDMIQLHGHETPERVAALKSRFGLPVMKALAVADRDDLNAIAPYEPVCDWILLDAKAADGTSGGTGRTFDWSLLDGQGFSRPWMLAGGLTPQNVGEAVRRARPDAVDVSSGVESSPGVKDPARIAAFLDAVHLP